LGGSDHVGEREREEGGGRKASDIDSFSDVERGRWDGDRDRLAAWRSDAAHHLPLTCSFSLRSCSRSLVSSSMVLWYNGVLLLKTEGRFSEFPN